MPSEQPARPWARWSSAGLLLLVVVLVALSPTFGRAHPSGRYRPVLPPDALANGCYPLPGGVTLGFPYQVRSDGDVGNRRKLVVQYDLINQDEAVAALTRSFTARGFGPPTDIAVSLHDDDPDAQHVVLERSGVGYVFARVIPLHPLKKDQIVRGTITFDLPRIAAQSTAAVCSDVTSTKRFPSDQASHDVGLPGGVE